MDVEVEAEGLLEWLSLDLCIVRFKLSSRLSWWRRSRRVIVKFELSSRGWRLGRFVDLLFEVSH